MTKGILLSDIELAKKLLAGGRPEEEIAAALAGRGIPEAKAVQIVQALRLGKEVTPEIVHVPLVRPGPGPRAPGTSPESPNPASDPLSRRRSGSSAGRPQALSDSIASRWWVFALVALAAGGLAWVLHLRHARNQERLAYVEAQKPNPPVTRTPDKKETKPAPIRIDLVLRQEGLQLDGRLLARTNALQVLRQVLGAPTRTNQFGSSGRMISYYDRHGLLVYSRPDGDETIVFDFEALGGDHGTEAPFAGSLQIEGTNISSDTPAQSLRGIQSLELTRSSEEGASFSARCQDLPLYFMYRQDRQRLRSVAIDFK